MCHMHPGDSGRASEQVNSREFVSLSVFPVEWLNKRTLFFHFIDIQRCASFVLRLANGDFEVRYGLLRL